MTMTLRESCGLCPYIREMQREAKRNALIRDMGKRPREEPDDELAESGTVLAKALAQEARRIDRQTKAKWAGLAKAYKVQIEDIHDRECVRDYLKEVREALDLPKRRRGEKAWIRTEKLQFSEEG